MLLPRVEFAMLNTGHVAIRVVYTNVVLVSCTAIACDVVMVLLMDAVVYFLEGLEKLKM